MGSIVSFRLPKVPNHFTVTRVQSYHLSLEVSRGHSILIVSGCTFIYCKLRSGGRQLL